MKDYIYYIPEDITDEYLISHYGFEIEPWHSHYNLIHEDINKLGLQIWWADRTVHILLGDHAEYGIAPIPDILYTMLQDGVIIRKEAE